MLPEAVGTRQPPRPAPTLATHGPGSTRQHGTAATALYGLICLEIAFADNTSLPEHTREQISVRIEQLLENPCQHGARPQGMLDLRWPVPGTQPFHVHEGTPKVCVPGTQHA